MKHKSALSSHLQRFQLLKKILSNRKQDIIQELSRLDRHYQDVLTQIGRQHVHQQLHGDNGKNEDDVISEYSCTTSNSTKNEDDCKDLKKQEELLKDITSVYNKNLRRLNEAMVFLNTKNDELLKIKRRFQSEYPLVIQELVKRNLPTEDDMEEDVYEDLRKRKDVAVSKMTTRLKNFRLSLDRRLNREEGKRELEDFLNKLQLLQGNKSQRGRPQIKLPLIVVSPHRTKDRASRPTGRSASVSKERMLNKAKLLRATKRPSSSNSSPILTPSSTWGRKFSAKAAISGDEAKVPSLNITDDSLELSKPKPKSEGENNSKEQGLNPSFASHGDKSSEIIQVPEVSSSVQDRSKRQTHNSSGESLTESSLLTLSTVSATAGDSSLQSSAASFDTSDVRGDARHEEIDPRGQSVTESPQDGDGRSGEKASGPRQGLLSRPRSSSRSRSRYIQIGLPEPKHNSDNLTQSQASSRSYRSSYPRSNGGSYPEQRGYLPKPFQPRTSYNGRSQSSHYSYRQTWQSAQQQGYYVREQNPFPRRSQSYHPSHCQNQRENLPRPPQQQNGGGQYFRQYSAGADPQPAVTVEAGQRQETDREYGDRRNAGSSAGTSSRTSSPVFSSAGSSSSQGEGERQYSECKDFADHSPAESELSNESEYVTVQLVRKEDVQRHRGPGLLTRTEQTDYFMYHKDKTFLQLFDFIQKKMQIFRRGGMRLWLFEDGQDGLFLPRRMIKGHLATTTLASLNRTTVTLFVQVAEPRERLFSFDHSNVRFVFVKAPHSDTGEFVVRGHHQVDLTKATRAVIQILKRKFLPQCQSTLKLYIESGGKKMYWVPHSPFSTLNADTHGKSRHGDVFVLLEDFVEQESLQVDNSVGDIVSSPTPDQDPAHAVCSDENEVSRDDEVEDLSGSQPDGMEEIQHGGVDEIDNIVSCEQLSQLPDTVDPTVAGEPETRNLFVIPYDYTSTSTTASDDSLPSPKKKEGIVVRPSRRDRHFPRWDLTSNYMSRHHHNVNDHTKTSDLGEDDPVKTSDVEEQRGEEGQQIVPEVGVTEKAEADASQFDSSSSVVARKREMDSLEYDSVTVFENTDAESVGYDFVSVHGEYGEDFMDRSSVCVNFSQEESDVSGKEQQEAMGYETILSEGAQSSCGDEDKDLQDSSWEQSSRSYGQQSAYSDPEDVMSFVQTVGEKGLHGFDSDSTKRIKDNVDETSLYENGASAATVNTTDDIEERETVECSISVCISQTAEDEVGLRPTGRETHLNPVAPVFTPRTLRRMRIQMGESNPTRREIAEAFTTTNSAPNDEKHERAKCEMDQVPKPLPNAQQLIEKSSKAFPCGEGHPPGKDPNATPFTPTTPHSAISSSSVFLSDDGVEDASVYYTPRPAFPFPAPHPPLQSTQLPLSDMNSSEDCDVGLLQFQHSQLNADQLSAIPNMSSSFMAIRLPKHLQAQLTPDQISAIPNISSSFMDIPPQHQIHHISLPSHSASFSGASVQQNGSATQHERSLLSDTSTSALNVSRSREGVFGRTPATRNDSGRQFLLKNKRTPDLASCSISKKKTGFRQRNSSRPLHVQPSSVRRFPATERRAQQLPIAKSEASLVKLEDPAIMDIKGCAGLAAKSSLNVNAMEFVPKGSSAGPRIKELKRLDPVPEDVPDVVASTQRMEESGKSDCEQVARSGCAEPVTQTAATAANTLHPVTLHPPVNTQLDSNLTGSQYHHDNAPPKPPRHVGTSALMPNPLTYEGAPNDAAATSASVCGAQKDQPVGPMATGVKPPIIITLTDGLPESGYPIRQRHLDTSRHVTFADQPQSRNAGFRRAEAVNLGLESQPHLNDERHRRFGQRGLHSATTKEPTSWDQPQNCVAQPRRRIGSGRFDDRPRRHPRELNRPQPNFPRNVEPPKGFTSYNYHPEPFPFNKDARGYNPGITDGFQQDFGQSHFHTGPQEYGRGAPGYYRQDKPQYVYSGPARYPPAFVPEQYYSDPQLLAYRHPYPPNAHHPARHHSSSTQPPPGMQTMYRQPKASHFQRHAPPFMEFRERPGTIGNDPYFRKRTMVQISSNGSSDQSDSSFHNAGFGFPNAQRFPRARKPANVSETETSVGSVTFRSETSNNGSVPEVSSQNGSHGVASSEKKTDQPSNASKQSLRVRRGYIQLGLGRPEILRSISDPNP